MSYRMHMIQEHGANDDDSWDDNMHRWQAEAISGGRRDGSEGRVYPQYPCYGCMSTFRTEAELLSHLSTVHGAS